MGASITIIGEGYTPPPLIDPIVITRKNPGDSFILNLTGCVLDRIEEVNLIANDISGTLVSNIVTTFSTLTANIQVNNIEQTYNIELVYPEGTILLPFVVEESTWVDLRLGGDALTIGNAAGNDIRHRDTMTATRDSSGLFFTGQNPWGSWVKVESLQWQRGQNLTCEWIFTTPDAFMMIGIGSTATNEASNSQFAQAEVQTYFNTATNQWGLYGNNGTVGSAGFDNFNTPVSAGNTYKIKFQGDGSVGSQYTIFQLPSANDGDWDDESNPIATRTIGGGLNPDEVNLVPFIIPRIEGNQRFIAVKVQ